ncbi:Phospholipase/carboxylesterase/thioesterase [Lasallia pustulata]|uniref:Acyl-protein thioesterase 1 n=1 Tax=Lasallia pustulata TaxID=136370 RepID=A0A1W5DCG1_9LECA|nr:Phospholipase/carboxylesterase/thioesterase [Lasallia pustulata]
MPTLADNSAKGGRQEDMAVAGLRETTLFLHALMRQETELLGDGTKLLFGGLSQGCAMALHAMLTFDATLGAVIGVSG